MAITLSCHGPMAIAVPDCSELFGIHKPCAVCVAPVLRGGLCALLMLDDSPMSVSLRHTLPSLRGLLPESLTFQRETSCCDVLIWECVIQDP